MSKTARALEPGAPYPLGATFDGQGVNFAVYSATAERLDLCLFDADGAREIEVIAFPVRSDNVWHVYLPGVLPGQTYGLRAHGAYAPNEGLRFNHHKLLLDPYARATQGRLRWSDAHFAYRVGSPRSDLSLDRRNNARGMIKSQVIDPAFSWGDDRRPNTPWQDTVIYETHVKGMTENHPDVPTHLQGTYAGLATAPVVEHLQRIGVTAIELLPVHSFIDDRYLVEKGLRNYWGYNSILFFAPDARYAATEDVVREFKSMVRTMHAHGIEVILDVVYNHTAEGNELGPSLCHKGLDNPAYYRLLGDQPRYYVNETGCGNTWHVYHQRALQLVMDSLRYWVSEMHVDGFRFDLCATLGREAHGFDMHSGFFDAVRQDPVLNRVKLIAEPWDIGPGGYQVGYFPTGWAELNDKFRDDVRQFWLSQEGKASAIAARLLGSAEIYDHRGRMAWTSINKIASHDGFTLRDWSSYNDKHNEANGEDNQDGHNANHSWNHGVEGDTDDPSIVALRMRQQRNMLATLLLSQGTPFLLGGDEINRTQQGNNNAYCQDNAVSWFDWQGEGEAGRELTAFTARLTALRRRHPVLRQREFLHGTERDAHDIPDVLWWAPGGHQMTPEQWQDPNCKTLGLLLNGLAMRQFDGTPLDDMLLVVLNAHHENVAFTLPELRAGNWQVLLRTDAPDAADASHDAGATLDLPYRCLWLLRFTPASARDASG